MLAKSNENWETGKECLADGRINVAANRLYYAVFQMVYDYAQHSGRYTTKVDSGVHAKMAKIVDDTINDKHASGRLFRDLKTLRETADYERECADVNELKRLLPRAERLRSIFIQKISGEAHG